MMGITAGLTSVFLIRKFFQGGYNSYLPS
jgi:retinol dehydrogenase-12